MAWPNRSRPPRSSRTPSADRWMSSGTLAAVDQVTISSEADGKVSRILADLGDRVKAGQVADPARSARSSNTRSSSSRRRSRARSRSTARPTRSICRRSRRRPTCRRPTPISSRRKQAYDARQRALQAHADLAADARRREDGAAVEAGELRRRRCRTRRTCAPASRRRKRRMKLADRQLRDTEIRAPFDGYVEKRLVNLGELVKTQMPVMAIVRARSAEGDRRDSREDGAVDQRRPAGGAARRRLSGPARSPARCRASVPAVNTATRAFPFEALVPNADAALKPGTFARVHIESGKVDDVLTLPYRGAAVPLRRQPRVRRRRRQAGGARAEGRRAARRPHRDRSAASRRASASPSPTSTSWPTARTVAVDADSGRCSMLSELCVRRPVFATMLVMSLVVLGIFSFRDLGVDLFPKADPATVNVALSLPGASPDEISTSVVEPMEEAISGVSGIDEIQARISEGQGARSPSASCSSATSTTPSNDVREKVAGAIQQRAAGAAAAGHHQGRSRRRPGDVAHRVVRRDEPADADRARRQADRRASIQTVNGVGQVEPRRRPRPRDPHRRRHREAELLRAVDRPRCATPSSRRTSRFPAARSSRARGSCCCARWAASTRPQDFNNIVVATKDGTPIRISDIGYAEDSFERPTSAVWLGDTPAVHARRPPRHGREHRRGHRGRPREARDDPASRCRRRSTVTVIRDDSQFIYASIASLEEHLLFGSLFADDRRDVLHPQPPRGDHRRRWPFRRRSSRRSR